jgi:hypothetical protein
MFKWSNVFSIPDPELVSDGSVDPMGMQLIWTYFGQLIFENKLTTVSSDVRNYTVNLFNHFVLYRFFQERNEEFAQAQKHFSAYREVYDAKAGMLIFLEDLFVYALMDQSEDVNTLGLLGSNKAQEGLDRAQGNYGEIKIQAERTKGVLVRQIQLGVNGRYKGPFMNMGLMTKNFEYAPKEFERVELLFANWHEGNKLVNVLLDLLSGLLKSDNKEFPTVALDKYRNYPTLWNLYARCFGQVNLNTDLKNYWLDKLGVTSGAARSIFSEIHSLDEQPISSIISAAYSSEKDESQKELLQYILDLEPFLSRCAHAFNLLANGSLKRLVDVEGDLQKLIDEYSFERILPLTLKNSRLKFLFDSVKDHGGKGLLFAEGILRYHKKIMEDRGGVAWVELDNDSLKHYLNLSSNVKTDEVVKGSYWYNRYYLDSVKSIYNGLNQN